MATIDESDLSALLSHNADLRLVKPHIYSVLPDNKAANTYDTQFGYIYDWVACNPIYNMTSRVIWHLFTMKPEISEQEVNVFNVKG